MSSVTLNNGISMPLVGLGTWLIPPENVRDAVYEAIRVGYRHIDAASINKNQVEIGEGIHKAISEGIITREDVWVTSKLWNDGHAKDDVEVHLRETLAQLKLDYLDLYVIQYPVTGVEAEILTPPYSETWAAMEAVQTKGLTRAIGVCNLSVKKLSDMKAYAKIWPAVNQVEMHPLFRQNALFEYCKAQGTLVIACAPLGSAESASFVGHIGGTLLQHEVVQRVAQETNKTGAQVLIRWALQRGTAVLPKSVAPSRIAENLQVYDWELSAAQFAALSSIEPQTRLLRGKFFVSAVGPYKSIAQLWDEEE